MTAEIQSAMTSAVDKSALHLLPGVPSLPSVQWLLLSSWSVRAIRASPRCRPFYCDLRGFELAAPGA